MSFRSNQWALTAALATGVWTITATATTAYPPPYMPEAMKYMAEHHISSACVVLLASPGKSTKVAISRSSGDEILDKAIVRGFAREVDVLKRMKLSEFPFGDDGRRIAELSLKNKSHGGGSSLGCPSQDSKAT